MSHRETEHLRVLIANERKDRVALVAPIVIGLGHEVIAREIEVADVGAVTARERPDVAREAACPVIVLLHTRDSHFVHEASKRGVETSAFGMLRERSRVDNRKLLDLAAAVVDGHRLLPRQPQAPASDGRE